MSWTPNRGGRSVDTEVGRVRIDADRSQSRPWDLGSGVTMTVVLPHSLSRKNIERLKKYVNALETEASISWDDDEEDGGGVVVPGERSAAEVEK